MHAYFDHTNLLIGALAYLVLALLAFAYTRPVMHPVMQRTEADTIAREVGQAIAYAIDDTYREYISVRLLGYSNSSARSHIRAYAKRQHSFAPDVLASIQRAAIARAHTHIELHPIHGLEDINEQQAA